jgi:DNA-binding MarR family transcriptional regulator
MDFLPLLRELAKTYQSVEIFSGAHIRTFDLTPPQFDLIATLGNQPPMTCKELGEKTLITKGTLTGVLDRLEDKGLINRVANADDARSQKIALTQAGNDVFKKVFPSHLEYLSKAFNQLSKKDAKQLTHSLKELRNAIQKVI